MKFVSRPPLMIIIGFCTLMFQRSTFGWTKSHEVCEQTSTFYNFDFFVFSTICTLKD